MRCLLLSMLAACSYNPSRATGDVTPDGPPVLGDVPMGDTPPVEDSVRPIAIVDSQVAGASHADFPLLFSMTAAFLKDAANGGDVTRADGFDIYFSADPAGTFRLAHEVERYDPAAGQLIAWVRIPTLMASTTVFLHYGSDSITTSQQDVANVWSAGYVTVLHLDDAVDATGNATTIDQQTIEELDSPLDRAQRYNGTDDRIVVGGSQKLNNIFAAIGSAEGWFFATGYGENGFGRIWDKGHTNGWSFGLDVTQHSMAFVHGDSDNFGEWNGPFDSVSLNAWHHAIVNYDQRSSANTPEIYVDGVRIQNLQVVDAPSGTMDDDTGNQLMAGNRGASDRTFQGMLDEIRMSDVPRSPEWILTQYRNGSNPSGFYTVGDPL